MNLRLRELLCAAGFALMAMPIACGVSNTGLGNATDGAAGGAGGSVCPAGLTELANWPSSSKADSCSRVCGPDGIGAQICSRTDRATCQAKGGCLCLEAPCVACADCAFLSMPTCYVASNAATAPSCANGVGKGDNCAPACDHQLCLRKDGKSACICNGEGKWACGDWRDSGWK
jgi:hypothetical protein